MSMTLIKVQPQPTYIESSGRWNWPLPECARFPGCCTSVVTASREWWEYAPSEAKPQPMSEAIQLRDGVWYWTIPDANLRANEPLTAGMIHEAEAHVPFGTTRAKRREFLATRLNAALAQPGAVCPCCGVTNLGEDCSELPWVAKLMAGTRQTVLLILQCTTGIGLRHR